MRCLLLIPLLLASWVAHGADFRHASWGESRAAVIKSEHRKPDYDKSEGIIYKDSLAGMSCMVVYKFNKHGLSRGSYIFIDNHLNTQLYLNDYSKIDGLLTQKYGAGEVRDVWHNPEWKDSPSQYASALQLSQLTKMTYWEHGGNVIIHRMENTGEGIEHILIYESKKTEMADEKATMGQL